MYENIEDAWQSTCWTVYTKNGWELDESKTRENFKNTEMKNGILRWKSSGNIPPRDCLSAFAKVGLITLEFAKKCAKKGKEDVDALLTSAYNAMPDEWEADPEFLWEARANCDEGNELINPIGAILDLKSGIWKKLK